MVRRPFHPRALLVSGPKGSIRAAACGKPTANSHIEDNSYRMPGRTAFRGEKTNDTRLANLK
jgi:hypothetical protein